MTNEEYFMRQIHSKKVSAFKRLFDEFYRPLVSFAMKYTDNQVISEDLVQDLFVTLLERDISYSSYSGFKTFLYNTIRNGCMDYLRHRCVEQKYIDHLTGSEKKEDELDDKIMKEELYQMLINAIDELPRRCREVLELHMKGLKNEDIAKELGLSILTVKTQKKRAIVYLRKKLTGVTLFFDFFLYLF